MQGVTRDAPFDSVFFFENSVFVPHFVGFLAFRVEANISPKFCFQPRCGQAAMWSEVSSGGTAPTARDGHAAVWSEAANGMYIFGGSPVLGAAARKRWRVPQPKDGRSCAEASSTTCISLTARPPERTEVGEASKQFPFGFARLWYFNCFETGETSNISCHQPCHFASYFFVSIPFFPKQFTVGVLNATLDLAALLLVGVVGFLGSEVVSLHAGVGCWLVWPGGGCWLVWPHLEHKYSEIKITGFNLNLLPVNCLGSTLVGIMLAKSCEHGLMQWWSRMGGATMSGFFQNTFWTGQLVYIMLISC